MKEALVIGCGNTLRGDDGAGVRAAELLAERRPDIECLRVHQLTPELAERIAECGTVIFLDADANATQVTARPIAPREGTDQPRTHFLSPESLLALSGQLYQQVPASAYAVGIPAAAFEFSERLSAPTARAVKESVDMIERLIPCVTHSGPR